ncbi:MAG: WHG domain-containing protein [Planctomycetia bacterium]|nr:WHG domain-containing protein [Planctomycetia bacterium]
MSMAAGGWEQLRHQLGGQPDLIKLGETYVAFAIRNEHLFRLMYDSSLWQASDSDAVNPENRELMVRERDDCFAKFYEAAQAHFVGQHLTAEAIGLRARLFASLSHGLATEFIDERLFTHIRDEEKRLQLQLAHARALLKLAGTVGGDPI